MIHLIETHGIECLIAYYLIIAVLGTMPPLPDNAGYYRRWLFAMAHAFCGNIQTMAKAMNFGQPKDQSGNGK